ncbi:MAG: DUF368 domain-containing protein [Firmicutes bacterium]|nr:DUF368 domain-containing protein [Bacillota bacterium]
MENSKSSKIKSWLIRVLKGVIIGSAFILPGISGGALAAIFGLYERIILFLASITKNFKLKNIINDILFFIPLGIGGIIGVFAFSLLFSTIFAMAEVQIFWLFIGFIVGTAPTLWRQSAREGRKPKHLIIMIISLVVAIALLIFTENNIGDEMPLNFLTWVMAGGITAIGMLIPGLSSATLLVFLQMYYPLTVAISSLNLGVIVPFGIGGVLTVLLLSRLTAFILKKAYATMMHVVIGLLIASTLLIIPRDYNYISIGGAISAVTFVVGIIISYFMCKLEDKYVED